MKRSLLLALGLCLCFAFEVEAAYKLKNGKLVDAAETPTMPVEDHYRCGCEAYEVENWPEAARQFRIVSANFVRDPCASDALFFLGVCYFYEEEYDFANDSLTEYLKLKDNQKYFQQAVEYKFAIAEQFAGGARRRILGTKKMPKWLTGRTLALKIYDEVIATLPCQEIAARALYSKGCLVWSMDNYRDAVDAFQMIIKRFPKHELAPESYLAISKVYLEQSEWEFQNPDLLAFAEINLRRFKQDYPREERICEVEEDVLHIKEIYANGLYETGQFYERKEEPKASLIYYRNAIRQFPDTDIADCCRARLRALDPNYRDEAAE